MADTLTDWQNYIEQINSLSKLDYNYDVKTYHESQDKSGWNVDHHHAVLTSEPSGPPVKGGPFERVCEVIRLYKFPDPRLISAVFDPARELRGRDMLMRAHFVGFTFVFGVRVTEVIDEVKTDSNGRRTQVWGYSYRTLKGHFEIGEIRFVVTKDFETGAVVFDIDSYSKPDRIPNFFFRVGFKVFGRWLQRYFASSSMARLRAVALTPS